MNPSQQASRLAFYLQISRKRKGTSLDDCAAAADYHELLAPIEADAQNAWVEDDPLPPLSAFNVPSDDFTTIAAQLFNGKAYHEVVLPFPPPIPVPKPTRPASFFENYTQELEKDGDFETRLSVNATYDRIASILSSRSSAQQQVAGLVVGRVQSGKTRNYVGLALKAADEGWNILVVLTSSNVALARQTRDRLRSDFAGAGMTNSDNLELDFLSANQGYPVPRSLSTPGGFLYWGVAMKESASLRRFSEWIADNADMAHEMRIIVVDDEADNASQNAPTAANRTMDPETASALEDAVRDEGVEFEPLANWVKDLPNAPMPTAEENSPDGETLRRISGALRLGAATKQRDAILNDAGMRRLLGLEPVVDRNGILVDLSGLATRFFSGTRGSGFRTAAKFCSFLRYALDIAMNRSAINAFLVDLMRRGVPGARSNPFARTAYLAYTATPFANILNERPGETPLYADFIQTLDEKPQYFGSAKIFGDDQTNGKPRMNIVREIPDEERRFVIRPLQGLKDAPLTGPSLGYLKVKIESDLSFTTSDGSGRPVYHGIWETMRKAIVWAFCAAAARSWKRTKGGDDSREARWTTMLVNISQLKDAHIALHGILVRHLESLVKTPAFFLDRCREVWESESIAFTKADFDQLFNSAQANSERYGDIEENPSWNEIEPFIRRFVLGAASVYVHPIVVNSSELSELNLYNQMPGEMQLTDDHLWILCGGNTISRGLTLPGLACSYFDRFRPSSAVDTMTQMGRWFGYRPKYELLPRLWMDATTADEMKKIAFIETNMHEGMRENFDNGFSPVDESHHQEIYCYGRRLSGRDAAQRETGRDVGTYGSTLELRTDNASAMAIHDAVESFLSGLGTKTDSHRKGYAYPDLALWETVPVNAIESLATSVSPNLPSYSSGIINRFISALRKSGMQTANVVLGEPQTDQGERHAFKNGITVKCSETDPKKVLAGVARFDTMRLHLPYYAMIPKRILDELDAEILENDLQKGPDGAVTTALRALAEKTGNEVPLSLLPIVGDSTLNDLPAKILSIARNVLRNPGRALPPPVHQLLGFIADGYRNRSSSAYMAKAHDRANHRKPIIQIQCIKPTNSVFAGLTVPLCSISFYWPNHSPSGFYTVQVS